MTSEDDPDTSARGPRYAGEDRRKTSSKELLGWYSYAWACEPFPTCGLGTVFLLLLLLLLTRARQRHLSP